MKHQSRWIDISLRNLLGIGSAVLKSASPVSMASRYSSPITRSMTLNRSSLHSLRYPEACEQLLAAEDKKYFLSIAQRPGQKPAPFIPVLDASFEVWFKKVRRSILESGSSLLELTDVDTQDSLWAAEDIDAIFDQDPQRVAILQGPVAVKHARVANRPIKEILGGIEDYIVKKSPRSIMTMTRAGFLTSITLAPFQPR